MKQLMMNSPVGRIYLVANEQGLCGVYDKDPKIKSNTHDKKILSILTTTQKQLEEYFRGKRKLFNIPLAPEGTDFQKKVWSALLKIPYGKTQSYADIAKSIKKPKACRAVGSANGKNPLWIIVPCHRVITSAGKIGGYAGGVNMKKHLLKIEGTSFDEKK